MTAQSGPATPRNGEWRRLLIESLQDDEATRGRIDAELKRDVLRMLAFFFLVFSPLISITLLLIETSQSALVFILALPALALAVLMPAYAMRFVVRMKSGTARARLLSDARRPILYLRSFDFDEKLSYPLMGSPEEVLAMRFGQLGPMIAVGRPNERLPPIGAARFYTSDETWRQKVTAVVDAAQFVVWVTGTTKGLSWELSHILQHLPRDRLIVVAHPQLLRLGATARQVEWSRFQTALGNLFPEPLPPVLGNAHLFTFDKTGRAIQSGPDSADRPGFFRRERNLHCSIDRLFGAIGLHDPERVRKRNRRRTFSRWLLAGSLCVGVLAFVTGNEGLGVMAGVGLLLGLITSFIQSVRPPPILPRP